MVTPSSPHFWNKDEIMDNSGIFVLFFAGREWGFAPKTAALAPKKKEPHQQKLETQCHAKVFALLVKVSVSKLLNKWKMK